MTYQAAREQHAQQRQLDPRVVRTRALLRNALASLMLERGYDDISIQEITDQAGLRRATFYLHYKDKEELLTAILDDMMVGITNEIVQVDGSPFDQICNETVIWMIFEHAYQNADLYRIILKGHGAIRIVKHVREYMAAQIRLQHADDLAITSPDFSVDVIANYMASSELSLLIWWLENDMPYPADQMARMCSQLMLNGFSQFNTSASRINDLQSP